MFKTLILGLFLVFGFDAAAQEKSLITFAINQAGGMIVEGEIPEFSGEIRFDENHPEDATAILSFNMASATTGVIERDQIMQAPEWLDIENYPKGQFVLEGLTPDEATGTLTLKGETKRITFPLMIDPARGTATGDLTIDRRDFKIGDGRWGESEKWVGFEIRISFKITADQLGEFCNE